MTEAISNVYDLIYPSPATLKEISCNALVTGLWRWKVENRMRDDFMPDLRADLHENLVPNIPSPVKRIIDECASRLVSSIEKWSAYHREKLLFVRHDMTSILLNFSDIIIDRNGTIHYSQTVRQLMMCDRLRDYEKFEIACMYCFEDDIRRIWPSVSEMLDSNHSDFRRSPELFYWICRLRNELDRIPNPRNEPIDVLMFGICSSELKPSAVTFFDTYVSKHWSAAEYFWNRISPENRLSETSALSVFDAGSFVRFILTKLSDQLLDRFVLETGSDLICDLVMQDQYKFYALPTWMFIRNKMNESNFTRLVASLMKAETDRCIAADTINENSVELGHRSSTDDQTYLCCEIWRNSPDEWKQSTVRNILTKDHLFVRDRIAPTEYREIRFLFTLLSDASFEDRNEFWKNNWRNLIVDTRGKDLHRIMKLCFEDENNIAKFKETSMSDLEGIDSHLRALLRYGYFEQFNDKLIFCCPDVQKRMNLKVRLLRPCFLTESFTVELQHLAQIKLFIEFINDAFDDAEFAADFKSKLTSFRVIKKVLHQCIRSDLECSSDHFILFIDTFVSKEEVTNVLQRYILKYVKNMLLNGNIPRISADGLQKILVWCLGNEEEVTKFKKSVIPMSNFFANKRNWKTFTPLEMKINDWYVGGFLNWYFRNPEEIDEFNRLFADRL